MKALRIQVERVVRPIRASYLRKDRMREELLAHLTRQFEEELPRSGDAERAAAAAIGRFGDASQLTAELQASVPRLERWGFVSLGGPLKRRPTESATEYLMRCHRWAFAAAIVGTLLFGLVLAVVASQRPHRANPTGVSAILFVLLGTVVIETGMMVGAGLLCERIRQQWETRAAATTAAERRQASWQIFGGSVAGALVLATSATAVMLLNRVFVNIPLITQPQFVAIVVGVFLLGIPAMLAQAWNWRASTRRFENWESLDLEEQQAA